MQQSDKQKQRKEKMSDRKKALINAVRAHGLIFLAAEEAEIDRATYYRWRDADPVFAAAFDQAKEAAIDRDLQTLTRRGIEERDTTALIASLKMRGRYDRPIETKVGVDMNGPIVLRWQTEDEAK